MCLLSLTPWYVWLYLDGICAVYLKILKLFLHLLIHWFLCFFEFFLHFCWTSWMCRWVFSINIGKCFCIMCILVSLMLSHRTLFIYLYFLCISQTGKSPLNYFQVYWSFCLVNCCQTPLVTFYISYVSLHALYFLVLVAENWTFKAIQCSKI